MYVSKTGKIGSVDELELADSYTVRQSNSAETISAFSIYQNTGLLEREASYWNAYLTTSDTTSSHLSDFDSARLISVSQDKFFVAFYRNGDQTLNEFSRKR